MGEDARKKKKLTSPGNKKSAGVRLAEFKNSACAEGGKWPRRGKVLGNTRGKPQEKAQMAHQSRVDVWTMS